MGDLGVIALFGSTQSSTLALMIYQQLGAYLVAQATVTAVLLLLLCLGVFRVSGAMHRGGSTQMLQIEGLEFAYASEPGSMHAF